MGSAKYRNRVTSIASSKISLFERKILGGVMPNCDSILKDGTFSHLRFGHSSSIDQILMQRFASTTYERAKSDTNLGFGVPIGEYFLNGDFSKADFEEKQKQIDSSLFYRYQKKDEMQIALSSGDRQGVVRMYERPWPDARGLLHDKFRDKCVNQP